MKKTPDFLLSDKASLSSHSLLRKTIWQVCESPNRLPEEYRKCRESWEKLNPEWRIELVTNSESRALFTDYLPEYLDVFDSLPLGVMKADMWRYAVLFVHGGLYADVDTYCSIPIDTWLSWADQAMLHICCEEATPWFCQWAICAPAGHAALKAAIDLIAQRVLADCGVNLERPNCVHHYTGPDAWSEAIKRTLATELPTSGILADRTRARAGGVIVHPPGFFSNQVIQHGYASFTWGNTGYISWRDDMDMKLCDISRQVAERLKQIFIPRICGDLKRYGGQNDGTFVLSQKVLHESVYLLSLGDDEIFDAEVASAGTEVITANQDILIDSQIDLASLIQLADRFISDSSDRDSIQNLGTRLFSLKIDTEGSEYRLLCGCPQELLDHCGQLSVEFHNLPNGGTLNGVQIEEDWIARESVVKKLLRTHYLVHLRGNNHGGLINGFPEVLECLFVHKNCFDQQPEIWVSSSPQPGIDGPNRLDSPELIFDWWTGTYCNGSAGWQEGNERAQVESLSE